jgi:hypothetical protein
MSGYSERQIYSAFHHKGRITKATTMHKQISVAFYKLQKLYFTMSAEYQHNRTENNIALTSQYMQQAPTGQEQHGSKSSRSLQDLVQFSRSL